ncbi:hypothetical protein Tco_0320923 [Tanacetum coccineum]
MVAPGPSNAVARRAVDELVEFRGETEDEVYDTLMCLRDDRCAEDNKLMALNDLIAEAEEDISVKERHLEIMNAAINSIYGRWMWWLLF